MHDDVTEEVVDLEVYGPPPEETSILSLGPANFAAPEPIQTAAQAEEYLRAKISKYGEPRDMDICGSMLAAILHPCKGKYANLYNRTKATVSDIWIAGALGYNAIVLGRMEPDEIDLKFGLTYR